MKNHGHTSRYRVRGRRSRFREVAALLAIAGSLPSASQAQSAASQAQLAASQAQSKSIASKASTKQAAKAKPKPFARWFMASSPPPLPPLPPLPRDPNVIKTVARQQQEIARPRDDGLPPAGSRILLNEPQPANIPPAPPLPAEEFRRNGAAAKDTFLDDSISEMPFRKEIHLILKRPTIVRVKSDIKRVVVGNQRVADVRWLDDNEPRRPGALGCWRSTVNIGGTRPSPCSMPTRTRRFISCTCRWTP